MKKTNGKVFIAVFTALSLVSLLAVSCTGSVTPEVSVTVEPVVFNPADGTYGTGQVVTMTSATEGVEIWYSETAINAKTYTKGTNGSEFTLSADCTIYAFAVDASGNISKRAKAVYTVIPEAEENTALYLGNPSGVKTDVTMETNYLMEKTSYALSYNNVTHNPNWVSWHLCADDLGDLSRTDFNADTTLPEGWYRVTEDDYKTVTFSGNGMTRGHMCPNMDRNKESALQKEVFLMTNMVPQSANNNNTVWAGLETQEVAWAKAGKELYIVCGPYGIGGTYAEKYVNFRTDTWGKTTKLNYITITNPNNADDPGIVVPASVWRVVLIMDEGVNDLSRITAENTTAVAIDVPNTYECKFDSAGNQLSWTDYIKSIDEIEEMTGYDFFANLPDEVENALESKVYSASGN